MFNIRYTPIHSWCDKYFFCFDIRHEIAIRPFNMRYGFFVIRLSETG